MSTVALMAIVQMIIRIFLTSSGAAYVSIFSFDLMKSFRVIDASESNAKLARGPKGFRAEELFKLDISV
jgi:hypothetical protein